MFLNVPQEQATVFGYKSHPDQRQYLHLQKMRTSLAICPLFCTDAYEPTLFTLSVAKVIEPTHPVYSIDFFTHLILGTFILCGSV